MQISKQARWSCPICRSKCCCSKNECTDKHRHCKAYRYRRRRAELALKRSGGIAVAVKKTTSKRPATPNAVVPAGCSDQDESADNVASPAYSSATSASLAETTSMDAQAQGAQKDEAAAAQRLCPALPVFRCDDAAESQELFGEVGEAPMWGHEMAEMAASHDIASPALSEDTTWLSDDAMDGYELGWPAQDKQEDPPLHLLLFDAEMQEAKGEAEGADLGDCDWLWSSSESSSSSGAGSALRKKQKLLAGASLSAALPPATLDVQPMPCRGLGNRLCTPTKGVSTSKVSRSTVLYEWA